MPPASRPIEDPPLLRGDGRYTGDYAKRDVLHAHFVRSTMAHARLGLMDLAQARALPGVIAVYAAADLDSVLPAVPAALDTLTNRDGSLAAAHN